MRPFEVVSLASVGLRSRSIKLARVDPGASINPDSGSQGSDTSHLALRSAFRKTTKLANDVVQTPATEIAQAVIRSNLNIRALDWAYFHKARKALPVAEHWDTVRSLIRPLVLHQRTSTSKRRRGADENVEGQPWTEKARLCASPVEAPLVVTLSPGSPSTRTGHSTLGPLSSQAIQVQCVTPASSLDEGSRH